MSFISKNPIKIEEISLKKLNKNKNNWTWNKDWDLRC